MHNKIINGEIIENVNLFPQTEKAFLIFYKIRNAVMIQLSFCIFFIKKSEKRKVNIVIRGLPIVIRLFIHIFRKPVPDEFCN